MKNNTERRHKAPRRQRKVKPLRHAALGLGRRFSEIAGAALRRSPARRRRGARRTVQRGDVRVAGRKQLLLPRRRRGVPARRAARRAARGLRGLAAERGGPFLFAFQDASSSIRSIRPRASARASSWRENNHTLQEKCPHAPKKRRPRPPRQSLQTRKRLSLGATALMSLCRRRKGKDERKN